MQYLNKENKKRSSHFAFEEDKEFPAGFFAHKSGKYIIEVNDQIRSVSQFSTAIQVLGNAKEDDEIEIHLQTNGGCVDSTGAFLHALRKCEAPIHVIATGGVHSCGTHILLSADTFELAENFNSLIHNGSAGAFGNINEYHSKSDFDKEFIRKLYEGIYEGFLTPQEFSDMMRGDNIWLNAQQWCDRSEKRGEYFRVKYEAEQAEALAAQQASDKPSKKPLTKGKQNAVQGPTK